MFLVNFWDERYDYPPCREKPKFYLLCGPPRVGSNLLCDLLHASECMGAPAEYFHSKQGMKMMAERLGLIRNGQVDLTVYIETLKSIRTTPNGVFGAKVQYWMMPPLTKNKSISKHFPKVKFIYLTRSDPIAQAVSLEIARQSKQWTSLHSAESASFDQGRNMEAIRFTLNEKVSWEAFFALNDIKPLRVDYERLIEDTENVCREVCTYVGVETDYRFSIDKAQSKRQRNKVNDEWIRRIKDSVGY